MAENPSQIPNQDKEKYKREQQAVIHLFQNPFLKQQKPHQCQRQQRQNGQDAENCQQAKEKTAPSSRKAVGFSALVRVGGVVCGCVAKEVFPCKRQSRSSRKKDTRTNGRVILKNAPTPIPEMV